ncbi:MAG: hypothetical protein M3283_00680, partial [Actinomycetota bacterium]|nr:hypothetical protein [Actinomycetota bacterium]
ESKQKQTELQNVAVESKRRFDAEWGIQGQKYKELREGLQRAISVGKQSFANTMQPGSDIELAQKAKIDEVKSLKQANQVAEEMPGEIITAAVNNWARICNEVQQRCVALLGPFAEALDDIAAPVDPDLSSLPTDGDTEDMFKRDYFMMLRSGAGGGMMMMGVTGMTQLLIPSLAVTAIASPVMPFVAVPVLAALIGSAVKGALSGQVKAAQQQLKVDLAEQFQKTRRHFFDVSLTTGSFSRVDEYFMTLDRSVNEHVRELVEKKSNESQAEIARLKEAMQLGEQERQAQTKQAQERLTRWDNIGQRVTALTGQIKALQRPAAPVKT